MLVGRFSFKKYVCWMFCGLWLLEYYNDVGYFRVVVVRPRLSLELTSFTMFSVSGWDLENFSILAIKLGPFSPFLEKKRDRTVSARICAVLASS
jgi:hypothetical protein